MKINRLFLLLILIIHTSLAHAQGIPVFDAAGVAQAIQQVQHMQKQLQEAQKLYNQAKSLHESFNQITNAKDLANLLNNPTFQKYLPQEYKQYSSAVNNLIQGNMGSIAQKYDYYNRAGNMSADDFFYQEVQRKKKETYQDIAIGEAVYDTASKRMNGLNQLKDAIGSAATPKEVMDLQARIQVETALLENETLRMRGLAMIQSARDRVDRQRGEEQRMKFIDELRSTARNNR